MLQQLVVGEPGHRLAEAFQVGAQSHDRPLRLKEALSLGLLEHVVAADGGTAGATDTEPTSRTQRKAVTEEPMNTRAIHALDPALQTMRRVRPANENATLVHL